MSQGPRGVVRVGDRVRFAGQVHTVVGLAGSAVRLADQYGVASLVLFSHLISSEGFELLDSRPETVPITPFGLLDTVPEPMLARARLLERHLVEAETGLAPDAEPGAVPRPEYDPKWHTLTERLRAKAAELTALGLPVGFRSIQRHHVGWREQGLWGLVDKRAIKAASGTTADERLVAVVAELLAAQEKISTGTRGRIARQAEALLAERFGPGTVPIPSRSTIYRLITALSEGGYAFGAATARRSQARKPPGPYTVSAADRPGQIVQIDSTPLDVLAILDDGVTGRPELTIAIDVATRTLCAAVLRPAGTKAVDAALLLARVLVPEPMRPGWAEALRMSASLIPHARLMSIDARLEHAAAKPVVIPETVVIDRGKVFISETFLSACRTLGISVQPARPATPTDKGVVERTFSSINTLFCQHVAGYVGSNTTRRGEDVAAVWTIRELADLFDEWVVAGWQSRPHDGLRSPFMPGRALSPNEAYALLVARTGYVPVSLSGEEYIELLPVVWRRINDYGIRMDYRTYDCRDLGPYRRQSSGLEVQNNLWEVHYDPYNLTHVWVRDSRAAGWITVPWTRLGTVSAPFADFTWRRARTLVSAAGGDDTDEQAIAAAVEDLLTRAGKAPDRTAARTRAANALPLHPGLAGHDVDEPEPDQSTATAQPVVPFGVFDAFTDGER